MSTPIGKIKKRCLCQNNAKKKYDMKTFTLILLTEKRLSVGCTDRAQLAHFVLCESATLSFLPVVESTTNRIKSTKLCWYV